MLLMFGARQMFLGFPFDPDPQLGNVNHTSEIWEHNQKYKYGVRGLQMRQCIWRALSRAGSGVCLVRHGLRICII